MRIVSILKAAAFALTLLFSGFSTAQANKVTFTVEVDTFATTLQKLKSGAAAATDQYTVGLQFNGVKLNGEPYNLSTIAFCAEIGQPISTGVTYTYDVVSLANISASTAGKAGTAASSMPADGIGQMAAARLNYLYDHFYGGVAFSDWDRTNSSPETLAFQLAQWEITHDTGLSLTAGNLWLPSSSNTADRQHQTLLLAQSWLDQVRAANVQSTYVAQNWDVIGLASSTNQDLVIAMAKNTTAVPEPSSMLLTALGLMIPILRRRRSGK